MIFSRSVSKFLSAGTVIAGLALVPNLAAAFCMVNQTDQSVLFAAQPHPPKQPGGLFPYMKSAPPGAKICHIWPKEPAVPRTLVYAFADENALEGCAQDIGSTQLLTLLTLEEFDRCAWKVE